MLTHSLHNPPWKEKIVKLTFRKLQFCIRIGVLSWPKQIIFYFIFWFKFPLSLSRAISIIYRQQICLVSPPRRNVFYYRQSYFLPRKRFSFGRNNTLVSFFFNYETNCASISSFNQGLWQKIIVFVCNIFLLATPMASNM